ncbi:MAG: cyclic nucleotide-binding domain-containing protein, partial [Saprospiraceae bacterium]|nr:cyclic nucleotide-binding domain-containing protein [Saprospiraceae bacterium]
MVESRQHLERHFGHLGRDLIDEIEKTSVVHEFQRDAVLLKEGQHVKVIPLVLEGLIKVITKYEDKEFLVYYIELDQTCIMSFAACLRNEPSRIWAIAEEPTTALLLPAELVSKWIKQYPNINELFFSMYQLRYNDLLSTINHLLFDR